MCGVDLSQTHLSSEPSASVGDGYLPNEYINMFKAKWTFIPFKKCDYFEETSYNVGHFPPNTPPNK